MAEQALDHTQQVQLLFDAKAGSWAYASPFRQAVQSGTGMPTEAMVGTMRATIQATERRRES